MVLVLFTLSLQRPRFPIFTNCSRVVYCQLIFQGHYYIRQTAARAVMPRSIPRIAYTEPQCQRRFLIKSLSSLLIPYYNAAVQMANCGIVHLFGYSSSIAVASSGLVIRSARVTLSKKSFISSLSFIHMGSVLHLPERSQ